MRTLSGRVRRRPGGRASDRALTVRTQLTLDFVALQEMWTRAPTSPEAWPPYRCAGSRAWHFRTVPPSREQVTFTPLKEPSEGPLWPWRLARRPSGARGQSLALSKRIWPLDPIVRHAWPLSASAFPFAEWDDRVNPACLRIPQALVVHRFLIKPAWGPGQGESRQGWPPQWTRLTPGCRAPWRVGLSGCLRVPRTPAGTGRWRELPWCPVAGVAGRLCQDRTHTQPAVPPTAPGTPHTAVSRCRSAEQVKGRPPLGASSWHQSLTFSCRNSPPPASTGPGPGAVAPGCDGHGETWGVAGNMKLGAKPAEGEQRSPLRVSGGLRLEQRPVPTRREPQGSRAFCSGGPGSVRSGRPEGRCWVEAGDLLAPCCALLAQGQTL